MKYILMHKDIPVCEIEISDASFSIENVSKIYNPEHIPLGLSENEKINLEEIKKDLPGKIGKFELPQYIEIWKEEDIPVTGNGKVRKKALRQIFEDKLKK